MEQPNKICSTKYGFKSANLDTVRLHLHASTIYAKFMVPLVCSRFGAYKKSFFFFFSLEEDCSPTVDKALEMVKWERI